MIAFEINLLIAPAIQAYLCIPIAARRRLPPQAEGVRRSEKDLTIDRQFAVIQRESAGPEGLTAARHR